MNTNMNICRMDGCCDLHVHTNRSDALSQWSPEEVILRARGMGITHLAISDHNMLNADYRQQSEQYGMDVISSAEMSAALEMDGKTFEIHVVGFRIDPENPEVQALAKAHQQDRRPYIEAMLDGLRKQGIMLTYEDLAERNPASRHLGRVALGQLLIEKGYAASMREVYSKYLGKESKSPSYVYGGDYLRYRQLSDVVEVIRRAGALPILAHLPYYGMTEDQETRLLALFKECAGETACMETEYGNYTDDVVQRLKSLAGRFGMAESTGSDFHGYKGMELKRGDPAIYRALQEKWEKYNG